MIMRHANMWIGGLAALALIGAGAGLSVFEADVRAATASLDDGARGGVVPAPRRIVSLNLCVDQILLDLVPRDRIAALSFLAADPSMSVLHREALGLHTIRGSAEEVLSLDPDLILAGEWTTPATVDLLRRLGRRVAVIPLASSFEGIRETVTAIADAAGEPARGAEMIAAFDRALSDAQAIDQRDAARPTAVAMQVNSIAAGPGSLVDEVLAAAGFDNLAARVARGPTGRVALETLIVTPPDVVVLANAADDFKTVLGDNLRHPAFRALASGRPSVHVPMADWLCGTPRVAGTVARLAAVRSRLASQLLPARSPQ